MVGRRDLIRQSGGRRAATASRWDLVAEERTPPSEGRSSRDGVGSPSHEPEVRPPVGEVLIDGDLEAVPLVERHVPRLLGEQVALDAVLVNAREPRSQQQASQAEALPRGVHTDQDEIPVRNGPGSLADAIMVLDPPRRSALARRR